MFACGHNEQLPQSCPVANPVAAPAPALLSTMFSVVLVLISQPLRHIIENSQPVHLWLHPSVPGGAVLQELYSSAEDAGGLGAKGSSDKGHCTTHV
jgi:hypothetical protein